MLRRCGSGLSFSTGLIRAHCRGHTLALAASFAAMILADKNFSWCGAAEGALGRPQGQGPMLCHLYDPEPSTAHSSE